MHCPKMLPPYEAHGPHDLPCDKGCQPDWHRDDCAIYIKCEGLKAHPSVMIGRTPR